MATPAQVAAEARAWIGTPFSHQGRSREAGVDCVGLVIAVARALGLVLPDFDVTGYGARPDGSSLRAACDEHMTQVDAPQMGGVVLMAWSGGPPQHLGLVADHPLGGCSLVHADGRRARCVVEQRLVFTRAMRLVAAYRLPGVH